MSDDDVFRDSSDDDAEPRRRFRPKMSSVCPKMATNAKCETSFDHKWKAVMTAAVVLPEFTQEELLRGFGVVMARLSHLEEAQRRDRLRILFLETERNALRDSMAKLDTGVQESFKDCAQLPGAPRYESVVDGVDTNPRLMTIHELKCLDTQLRRLKPNGKRAEQCSKIMAAAADSNGVVTWDVVKLPTRKQWQLFYYIFFGRVEVKETLTERAEAQVRALDVARPLQNIQIATDLRKHGTEEDLSDYDVDFGDEGEEADEENNLMPRWEGGDYGDGDE